MMRLLVASTAAALVLTTASARAEEPAESSTTVEVPPECEQFGHIPGGAESPVAWSYVLSFAACIQDATIARIERADQLEPLVGELLQALEPALQFYIAAIDQAPGPAKLRAAYQIGLGQLTLITRARASIAVPEHLETDAAAAAYYGELHAALEPLLVQNAKLAFLLFVAIDRAAAEDPTLAPDAVTRNMVRSSHELAELIGKSWSLRATETETPMFAFPR
jgi:hypothetical protein